MEWKLDEKYLFHRAVLTGATEPWPTLGQTSGAGMRNAPLSLWVWAGLAKLGQVTLEDPTRLARMVQMVAVLSIAGFFGFALRRKNEQEREAWLWAAALGSVNFLAVLLQRRIWIQCIFPPFCLLFLMSWWKRQTRWGSFFFGLMGMVMGQLHLSGFFLFGGVTLAQGIFRRRELHWRQWGSGVLVGMIPALTWIRLMLMHPSVPAATHGYQWREGLLLRFFRNWIDDSWGLGLDYSLGIGGNFPEFLGWNGMGVLRWGLTLLGATIGVAALVGFFRSRKRESTTAETSFLLAGAFFGAGFLFTASALTVQRHYLAAFFPLVSLSIAWLAVRHVPRARVVLMALWLGQFAMTAGFLVWTQAHCGAPRGDYGQAYRCQTPEQRFPAPEWDPGLRPGLGSGS